MTLAAAVLAAGCFTDPVNMPPTIRIDAPTTPIFRGTMISYTATASDLDNDGDPLTVEWALTAGACPPDFLDPVWWPPASAWTRERSMQVTADPRGSCVWAKAVDKHGASAVDAVTCDARDHAPSVQLVQVPSKTDTGTFPPNTSFQFSASLQDPDPGDPSLLSLTWSLASAPSDGGVLVQCTDDPSKRCLDATAIGTYVVAATVSDAVDGGADGSAASTTSSLTFVVAPGPPPIAEISVESVMPSVDDGDGPFKLGSTFRLSSATSHRANGSLDVAPQWLWFTPPGGPSVDLTIPENFAKFSCGGTTPSLLCFTANAAGPYAVELQVSDGYSTGIVTRTISVVPDQPACITATSPPLPPTATSITTPSDSRLTLLSVDDDLDPFPGSAAVSWFVEEADAGGTPQFVFVSDFPTLPVGGLGRVGDVVKVRLEVQDRDTDRSTQGFLVCGDDAECALTNVFRDPCLQRVTFNVRLQ